MNNLKVEFIDGSIAVITSYTYTESGIHIHSGTIIENGGEPCLLDLGEHVCKDHEYNLISVFGTNGKEIPIFEEDHPTLEDNMAAMANGAWDDSDLPADFWDQHTRDDGYHDAAHDTWMSDNYGNCYERS